ncbi:MAG: transglutaminase-like domain-containing protein [Planctomycetota bacterium]|jgi:hypothetical protein
MSFWFPIDSLSLAQGRRVSGLGLAVLLLLCGAAQASEEWQAIHHGEVRVGYARIERDTERRDGKTLHRTTVEKTFSYFQTKQMQYSIRETVLEDKDGALVEVAYLSVMEEGKRTIRGTVEGDKIAYTIKYPGQPPSQMKSPYDAEAIGPRKVQALIRSKGLKEGTAYTYKTYSFINCSIASMSVKVRDEALVLVGGKERKLRRVVVEGTDLMSGRRPVPRTRWYDKGGALVMVEDRWLVGRRSWTFCSEAEATASGRGAVSAMALTSPCKVQGNMIRPSRVDSADFWVRGTGKMKGADLRGPGQSARKKGNALRVTVRRPRARKAARPCTDAGKASALEATYFIDHDQGEVAKLAKRLVGGEKDSGAAAELLRKWTFERMKKRELNKGMASASTALAVGAGDAIEHALVLAALCRAVGIPSRLVGGLQIMGGLAYVHAWTEVWTGAWIPFDAMQDSPADAARIRFSASELKDSGPDAVLVALAGVMQRGALSVEVNAYTIGGVAVDKDKPNKDAHVFRGNTYTHRFYGFSFQKPPKFRFQEHLRGMPYAVIAALGGGGMQEKILIRANASTIYQTLREILTANERTFRVSNVKETLVGGRPAIVAKMIMKGGGYSPLTCYVHAGDTILTIECSDKTFQDVAAFELAMKTLLFD